VSRWGGYLIVALRSVVGAAPLVSGVPSSKQKFRERSAYVRLQVGQRFMLSGAKIKGKLKLSQERIALPQRPQNFVPAG